MWCQKTHHMWAKQAMPKIHSGAEEENDDTGPDGKSYVNLCKPSPAFMLGMTLEATNKPLPTLRVG
jgi:hypothetical protein